MGCSSELRTITEREAFFSRDARNWRGPQRRHRLARLGTAADDGLPAQRHRCRPAGAPAPARAARRRSQHGSTTARCAARCSASAAELHRHLRPSGARPTWSPTTRPSSRCWPSPASSASTRVRATNCVPRSSRVQQPGRFAGRQPELRADPLRHPQERQRNPTRGPHHRSDEPPQPSGRSRSAPVHGGDGLRRNETTTCWIAHTLYRMITDTSFDDRLRGGRLGVDDALDEVLWREPPMTHMPARYALRDIELGGQSGTPRRRPDPRALGREFGPGARARRAPSAANNRAHMAYSAVRTCARPRTRRA